MHMVWEVSSTNWPTLTCTNYGEWSMTMKVKLRARRLWNAIDKVSEPYKRRRQTNRWR